MSEDFQPGDRVRFTEKEIVRYPWLVRGILRFVNRRITWRVAEVIDGDSAFGQLAVQFDVKRDVEPTVLPIDMFEHADRKTRIRKGRQS